MNSLQLIQPALAALNLACGQCQQCALAASREQVVVGRGNPLARLMLIGEAPGAQEDGSGIPFVGRSGQLLDQLLREAGLCPDQDVYICNALKCRPPGNRRPTAAELGTCRPWLEQQIQLVNPAVIGLLGATALAALLGIKAGLSQLRGKWLGREQGLLEGSLLEGRSLMPLFHPSYLLRNPSVLEGKPRSLTLVDLGNLAGRIGQLPALL